MTINRASFADFKPYSAYAIKTGNNVNTKQQKKGPQKGEKSLNQNAFLGAAIGTVAAISLSSKTPVVLSKFLSKEVKKDSILADYVSTIIMAAGANVGGVLGGSVGADKEKREKKVKEGAFQIMNIAIPMTLVTLASALCKNTKALNNNPCKIIGSITGMVSGAYLATKITNATKDKDEPIRKYTLKDATANFDDIVATIKIGFKNLAKKIPVDTILPFIYLFAGTRAGSKE